MARMGGGYQETNQGDANRLSLFFALDLKTKQEAFELLGQGKYQEVCEYLNKNVLGKTWNHYVSRVLLPKQDNNLKANLEKKVKSILREQIIEKEKGNIENLLNSAEEEYKNALESRLKKVVEEFCYLSTALDKVGELEKKFEERKQKSRLKRTAEILKENYQCLGREDLTIEGQFKELNKRIDQAKDLHNSVTDLYYKDVNCKLDDLIGKYEAMAPDIHLNTELVFSDTEEIKYEVVFKNNSVYPWKNPMLHFAGKVDVFGDGERKTKEINIAALEGGLITENSEMIYPSIIYSDKTKKFEVIDPQINRCIMHGSLNASDYSLAVDFYIPNCGPIEITKFGVKGRCEHAFIKRNYNKEDKLF